MKINGDEGDELVALREENERLRAALQDIHMTTRCDKTAAKARAALDGQPAPSPWRPIDTAPRDELILVGPTKRMGICAAMYHSRDGWVTETCSDWVPIHTPTHWMPLPPPPEKGGE